MRDDYSNLAFSVTRSNLDQSEARTLWVLLPTDCCFLASRTEPPCPCSFLLGGHEIFILQWRYLTPEPER